MYTQSPDDLRIVSVPPPIRSNTMGGDGWGSPLAEIDFEDSVSDTTRVSDTTLVRAGTPPRGKRDS